MSSATPGWRRLSPSAQLFIDPENGARSAIRDTGNPGAMRYLWTLTVFGEQQLAEGRAADQMEARLQARAALKAFIRGLR
jgi:hypothetical protein